MQNNQEDKLLVSKIMDKFKISRVRNKVMSSDFLNEYQIAMIKNELTKNKISNYEFSGGYEEAESKVVIAFPEATKYCIADILKAIKIKLPNELSGKIKHKDYLGTVMSFGLARERIGDIIVYDDMAYIIVIKENAEYIKSSFEMEKRFKKVEITIIDVDEIITKNKEFENINISVNSNRLDTVIKEIINTSRKIAQELIDNERVSVNYSIETKSTKQIKEQDILIIRGHGKYIIDSFLGKNKKDKEMICVKKYK